MNKFLSMKFISKNNYTVLLNIYTLYTGETKELLSAR